MNPILEAANELQQFLLGKNLPYCFIEGIAVLRWGRPRTTQDVDVSLFVTSENENQVVSSLLERFQARISDAHEFALQNRVVLAVSTNQIALDIALAQFEFEKQVIDRATPFAFANDVTLLTVSADDLVVMKSFAGRDQDWLDVKGIVGTQNLNLAWIIDPIGLLVRHPVLGPSSQSSRPRSRQKSAGGCATGGWKALSIEIARKNWSITV